MYEVIFAIAAAFFGWMAYGTVSYSLSDEAIDKQRGYEQNHGTSAGWKAGVLFWTALYSVLCIGSIYLMITI